MTFLSRSSMTLKVTLIQIMLYLLLDQELWGVIDVIRGLFLVGVSRCRKLWGIWNCFSGSRQIDTFVVMSHFVWKMTRQISKSPSNIKHLVFFYWDGYNLYSTHGVFNSKQCICQASLSTLTCLEMPKNRYFFNF